MSQPLSSFIARNAGVIAGTGRLLWMNPPGDAPWRELAAGARPLELFCQDRADWRALAAAGAQPGFGDFPDAAGTTRDAVLLTLPREKQRLRMLAQWAAAQLGTSGRLWVAGENQAGIRSSPGPLGEYFQVVSKRDSARHCALIEASQPRPGTGFSAQGWCTQWMLERPAGSLTLHSWPGVFAHGTLDPGTALLLDHLPALTKGARVLDFACGSGVIGAALLQAQPALDCVLTDASALALRAARETLLANGLRGEVVPSDGLLEIHGRFDLVVSNPPWHQRHLNRPELGTQLLEPVRQHLSPGGQLLLVAKRHLPWPRWLDQQFGRHECLATGNGYQVLRAIHGPDRGGAVISD